MSRSRTMLLALLVALPALAGWAAARPGEAAPQDEAAGWFHVVWGEVERYFLVRDDGRGVELAVDGALLRALGGPLALDRRRVAVAFEPAGAAAVAAPPSARPVRSIRVVGPSAPAGATGVRTAAAASQAVPRSGAHPYVTILCKFPDHADREIRPVSQYQRWALGTDYPSFDHYWREASEDRINVSGSQVAGWYTLPEPRSAYMGDSTSTSYYANLNKLATDCTALADGDVHFPSFYGINLQFNTKLDCCSWGGSRTLTYDGETRAYGFTWMADWAGQSVYIHEMGHSLGLPHSSGPYGKVYDSKWDVMSNAYINYLAEEGSYVGQHTIAFHKEILGWIPAERSRVVGEVGTVSFRLARGAVPGATGYLQARIPLPDGSWYTAEYRRRVGYDGPLPGEAVVLHRVSGYYARVVDPDANGDPNDAGAQWMPGETFTDEANLIALTVDAVDQDGADVTVIRGGFPLQVVTDGSGRVTSEPVGVDCPGSCTGSFGAGTRVALTAEPASGWTLVEWSGACTGNAATCTVVMNTSRSVSALFLQPVTILSSAHLGQGIMGARFERALEAAGGTGDYRWGLVSGALPRGVGFDDQGVVGGIPEEAGTFRFIAQVASGPLDHSSEFTLEVLKPALPTAKVMDALLGPSDPLTPDERRFLDLLGNRNGRLDVGDVRAWLVDGGSITAAAGAPAPPQSRGDDPPPR